MIGLVLALAFGGALAGAPLSAFLVPRLGQRKTVFAGIALVGLGLLPLAYTGPAAPVVVGGAAADDRRRRAGPAGVAYTDMVTATLPVRDRGVAGSLALLTRTVGIVGGASVLTALHAVGAAGLAGQQAFLAGYRFAFRRRARAAGGVGAVLPLAADLVPRLSGSRQILMLPLRMMSPNISFSTMMRVRNSVGLR